MPVNRPLLRSGFVLILLALLTGLVVPQLANPRLGLAAHTVGLFGGLFLVVLGGVVVPILALGPRAHRVVQVCWVYAVYANWLAALCGALTGASRRTPLAGAGTQGGPVAEGIVEALLLSLSLAALVGAGLVLWGLRRCSATDP